MLDGPPIKMVVLSKPITYGRIFECGRSRRFIASIEDRIDAHFSDISKSDEAIAPPPPLPEPS